MSAAVRKLHPKKPPASEPAATDTRGPALDAALARASAAAWLLQDVAHGELAEAYPLAPPDQQYGVIVRGVITFDRLRYEVEAIALPALVEALTQAKAAADEKRRP